MLVHTLVVLDKGKKKGKKSSSKLYWANYLTGCDGTQKTAHGPSGLHLS